MKRNDGETKRDYDYEAERDWQRLVLAVLAFAFLFVLAGAAAAAEAEAGAGEGAGGLLLHTAEGVASAPWLDTQVDIDVSGPLARVRVRQRFQNLSTDWAEGVYLFPLPERAAVDRLRMRVGERLIEGEIRERTAARETFSEASRQGKKAVLVEQSRPNLFRAAVANIAPRDTIEIEIAYLETLDFSSGHYRLRFPLTVAPRYRSGQAHLVAGGAPGDGPPERQAADEPRFEHAVLRREEDYRSLAGISVRIDAGLPLSGVASASHDIVVSKDHDGHRVVFADGKVPMDRDFELSWAPATGGAPGVSVFTETVDGEQYVALLFIPQPTTAVADRAREAIFVIDTSGSMHGDSLVQARAAIREALRRLGPQDRFNLIEFNAQTRALYDLPVPVSNASRSQAEDFLTRLHASGGTEMGPAIDAALEGSAPPGFLRQVVFVTDGAVGNEEAIFERIRTGLGATRLFTIGIGSAPNLYFMRKAAEQGRGSHTTIASPEQVSERMDVLLRKIERPALTDLAVSWPDGAEVWPRRIPDVYGGEPVVVTARIERMPAELEIEGRVAGTRWQQRIALPAGRQHEGIASLWARRQIDDIEALARRGALDPESSRLAIVDLSLRHRLVSRHASLVAVDRTPVRPQDASLKSRAVPSLLPAGMDASLYPATATPAFLHLATGLVFLLLAGLIGFLPGSHRWR